MAARLPKVTILAINGTLTLDGQGNPNALFIFKINGAFSTGTFSNVVLINSASLCNVYWQVGGQFDLGNNSVSGEPLFQTERSIYWMVLHPLVSIPFLTTDNLL
jgi:hypothetical protein